MKTECYVKQYANTGITDLLQGHPLLQLETTLVLNRKERTESRIKHRTEQRMHQLEIN